MAVINSGIFKFTKKKMAMNMKTSSVFVKSLTPKRQSTAPRTPCTPKTPQNPRQTTPSKPRTPRLYHDRYVPSRSAGDVEFSRFQINTPPRSALKSAENTARNSNTPSGCAMRDCLLALKGQSSENRVLAFHQPGPTHLTKTTTGKCKLLLRLLLRWWPIGPVFVPQA